MAKIELTKQVYLGPISAIAFRNPQEVVIGTVILFEWRVRTCVSLMRTEKDAVHGCELIRLIRMQTRFFCGNWLCLILLQEFEGFGLRPVCLVEVLFGNGWC
jgi:hypothetical protein